VANQVRRAVGGVGVKSLGRRSYLVGFFKFFIEGVVISIVKSSPTTALAEVSTKRKVEKESRNNN
jgi:hypothetical protein